MSTLDQDRAWLLAKAKEEDNGIISVGGLVCTLSQLEGGAPPQHNPGRLAFSKLIELRRRERRLTIEQLAKTADVDLGELLDIESGQAQSVEPRTVHQLAQVLRLPGAKLLQLSGLAIARDEGIEREAVRFAARSEPIGKLNHAEYEALEEFVRFLARP